MGVLYVEQKNITKILSEYLADARFEDLPNDAVEATKSHILHTLGTIIAGSRAPGVQQVLNCVSQWGAKDESTVLVYGNKLPAPSAALVNATMGHCFHIDVKDDRRSYPTGVAAIPAALALVERLGRVSGKELINAVCLGVDLGIRISLAIKPPRQTDIKVPKAIQGFIQMLGPFAAAAACCKLLRLDKQGIYNALAISCRRAGVHGVVMGIPALNEIHGAGFPSASGVQSALLAAEGFPTPDHDAFQGAHGYFQLFYKEEGDLDLLTSDLGKRYEIVWANPKPFPSHRGTHPGLTGVLAIIQKENIKAEQVEEVRIYVEKGRKEFFESERSKRYRPPRLADVQHSHPYLAAVLLLKGRLSIEDFTEEAIRNETVLKLAERVKVLHDPKFELDHGPMVIKPNVVEIAMKDGRTFSERVEYPKGHPNNPLTQDDKVTYFRDLTKFSAKPLSSENIEKTISLVSELEHSADVSGLCRLLT
jgi:2-methylcitrate dehydratase PrpD